jgi:hypothetical protein
MFHRLVPKKIMKLQSARNNPNRYCRGGDFVLTLVAPLSISWANEPYYQSEFLFRLEKSHNHGSSSVELPNGDLLVAWYRGSGEHEANDVRIMGARKVSWWQILERSLCYGRLRRIFPDANPVIFIDGQKQLQLIWSVILANDWRASVSNTAYRLSISAATRHRFGKSASRLFYDLKDICMP